MQTRIKLVIRNGDLIVIAGEKGSVDRSLFLDSIASLLVYENSLDGFLREKKEYKFKPMWWDYISYIYAQARNYRVDCSEEVRAVYDEVNRYGRELSAQYDKELEAYYARVKEEAAKRRLEKKQEPKICGMPASDFRLSVSRGWFEPKNKREEMLVYMCKEGLI